MGEGAHANRAPAPAPEARRGGIDSQAIRGAVPQELSRPQASLFYRLGLLLVAGTMVLLPLLYLGLVGLVGYGAPIGAGAVLVAFLLKPLFGRAIRPDPKRALAPSEAPLLLIRVRQIAKAVGAAEPVEQVLGLAQRP